MELWQLTGISMLRFNYIGFRMRDAQVFKWDVDFYLNDGGEVLYTHMIHGQMGFFTSHNSGNDNDEPDIEDKLHMGR